MMRRRTTPTTLAAALLGAGLALAGCGQAGSSGTTSGAGPSSAGSAAAAGSPGGATCAPVAGQQLVVLQDDKKLQTVDNIIPAINAKAATAPLMQALDKVSAALTTDKLIAMNKATDLERKTPANVAKDFVQSEGLASGVSGGSGNVIVGAANFSENQTLANIYAQALDAAGFTASVKTVGNRELYEPALEKGEIQVVPEYVGTLTQFLAKKQKDANAKASSDLQATVTALTGLGQKAGLKFGQPAQAADQNAFAVTTAFADRYAVKTLSDLASKCSDGLVLGGPPECAQRPFCRPGLEQTYGLKFTSFTTLDAAGPLSKTALKQGKVSLALVLSSDPSLTA